MSYYHDAITEQSWNDLQNLHTITPFILIGGWATYLYTNALKSKDIDIIVEYDALPKLSQKYELIKNDRLKKYEARRGPVQIDIYLPHYSELGIPTEILREHVISTGGFTLLEKEYLTALKLHTLEARARTSKGEKDFLDVVSLLRSGEVSLNSVFVILRTYKLDSALATFTSLLSERTSIPELEMNVHMYGRWKKKIVL